MNFEKYLENKIGKDATDKLTHAEKYQMLVLDLGYEDVKKCVPFTIDQIVKSTDDQHLNDLPIRHWDIASGFICNNADCKFVGSQLTRLYKKLNVTAFSNANGVCILKQCARMMKKESVLDKQIFR